MPIAARNRSIIARRLATLAFLALAGCATQPQAPIVRTECPAAVPCPACPVCPAPKPEPVATPTFTPATFADLPGWAADDVKAALAAFRVGCQALRNRAEWRAACERAAAVPDAEARAFLEREFTVWQLNNADGTTNGLVTGYYEPLLRGSRTRTATFRFPVLAPPDDLIVVDLTGVVPETRNMRLRGRIEGRRMVPYWSRAEIESGRAPLDGKAIAWVDDPIELFFLQVQGSGRIRLPDGGEMRVGYADQNGHPYRSIGRYLVEIGALQVEQASMQGIQAWANANPRRLDELLNHNPSYVFFREVPAGDIPPGLGARGSLGVPLTPERSIAVDNRVVPLGAFVWLATTRPNDATPLERLMVAQDTGGAIRGAVRADFFWGFGADPASQAGRMRQQGRMWVLLPRGYPVPTGTLLR
jgi:membrane-bound lytic murein transglycosylase A